MLTCERIWSDMLVSQPKIMYSERFDEFKQSRLHTSVHYYKSSVSYYSWNSFNTLYYKYQFYWKKRNTYLFLTLLWMYIIVLFVLSWMSTLLDSSYLFILRCCGSETLLRRWRGRGRWSKVRLQQEKRFYSFESFSRNKK